MKRHARLAWLVIASLTIPAAAGFTALACREQVAAYPERPAIRTEKSAWTAREPRKLPGHDAELRKIRVARSASGGAALQPSAAPGSELLAPPEPRTERDGSWERADLPLREAREGNDDDATNSWKHGGSVRCILAGSEDLVSFDVTSDEALDNALDDPTADATEDWLDRHLRHASQYAAGARALLRSLYTFLES